MLKLTLIITKDSDKTITITTSKQTLILNVNTLMQGYNLVRTNKLREKNHESQGVG